MLFPLSLPTGYILAAFFSCGTVAPPPITLTFQNNPPGIDNSKSSQDLVNVKTQSTSPNYGGEFPIVSGLTYGDYRIDYKINFLNSEQQATHSVCVRPGAVNITIIYSPVVYVASNYKPGSCRYDLTEDHELHHVGADVTTINEVMPSIKLDAETLVTQWHGLDPVDESQMKTAEDGLSKQLSDVLGKAADRLQQLRLVRQQAVDSREEYRRLSEACPNEPLL